MIGTGDRPRLLIATTPRITPLMKRLVAMDDVRITTGSTYDNAEHLSADFLKKVRELYEGTRLGRQELQGAGSRLPHCRDVQRGRDRQGRLQAKAGVALAGP
jgi:phage terminase large subunit-like protein